MNIMVCLMMYILFVYQASRCHETGFSTQLPCSMHTSVKHDSNAALFLSNVMSDCGCLRPIRNRKKHSLKNSFITTRYSKITYS